MVTFLKGDDSIPSQWMGGSFLLMSGDVDNEGMDSFGITRTHALFKMYTPFCLLFDADSGIQPICCQSLIDPFQ
jgi:hypothetical protein